MRDDTKQLASSIHSMKSFQSVYIIGDDEREFSKLVARIDKLDETG